MADDPYSRSYWRFRDEYPDIYRDDAAYALWHRLLILGDMAWPSSASLPHGTRRKPLDMLAAAGLITLETDGRFRVRGMDKHRKVRSDAARYAVNRRWDTERSTGRSSIRNADRLPSRDETRKEEAVVLRPEEQREHLDSLKTAMEDAGIPLPSKPNGVERKPYTDTDVIEHCRSVIADEDAPDWKRDAARAQLEAMRVQP